MQSISKRIAWLCLLLMLSSAIAFVAHHHSETSESARCTVCVAAHSASPAGAARAPRVTFIAVSTFRAEPITFVKRRLTVFALFVRPPPEVQLSQVVVL